LLVVLLDELGELLLSLAVSDGGSDGGGEEDGF
jgi:hypothetical protein